ncbi:MAG: HNH endonuclease [Proteobacteria bacterium]|nr:HNH endonuclease [Pseudomonadota bacterium]
MINLFIANTDNSWFDFLSKDPHVSEANFWWPGETNFRALKPGELLVFRLKSPRNVIGGFGVFSSHSLLPIQTAWEAFGTANGCQSAEALRLAISHFRQTAATGNTNIGCTVLVEPIFLPPEMWIELPASWSRAIQRGKLYSTSETEGAALWQRLLMASSSLPLNSGFSEISQVPFSTEGTPRYGVPTLITPRLGQGAFRIAVTEAYGRQCAISGGKVLPALDAAHIKPYGEGGLHTESNGILLRKDIHSVFDAGYVTIDEGLRFCVSNNIRDIFNNGEEYLRLHGRQLRIPDRPNARPAAEYLRWHNSNRYVG